MICSEKDENASIQEKNVLLVTLDSCRYDSFRDANLPFMKSIAQVRKAYAHGTYTVPAHTAIFSGHLPAAVDNDRTDYYSESAKQLWRIKTGFSRDDRKTGIVLEGNNILEGYRKKGFYVLGAGGVTQFSEGSLLRSFFKKDFLYYGLNLDEEPLAPREKYHFPLNHTEEIKTKLENHEQWFLFINCPETHYPYDFGEGMPTEIQNSMLKLKQMLNLREPIGKISIDKVKFNQLHQRQILALEKVDSGIERLASDLPRNRSILTVICGDHGENFGEYFCGKRRWGHLMPGPKVMEVPLLIGEI